MKRIKELIYRKLPFLLQNILLSIYAFNRNQKFRRNKYYQNTNSALFACFPRQSKKEIIAFQQEKLYQMLKFSLENIPFYKALNISPSDLSVANVFEDIKKFPIVDKAFILKNKDLFINKDYKGEVYHFKTSGTTGSPFSGLESGESTAFEYMIVERMRAKYGYKKGMKITSFIGRKIIPPTKIVKRFYRINYYDKQQIFSYWHYSKEKIADYIEQLNTFAPQFINGYPSFLYLIAKDGLAMNLNVIQVNAIFTSSEKLLPYQKDAIMKFFKAPIGDYYGQTEHVLSISSCKGGNYHLEQDLSYLETLDNGYVLATNFYNKAMPLIRYRITDKISISTIQHCNCDSNFQVMNQPDGREEDYILSKNGNIYGRLDHLFKESYNIKEAQIRQVNITDLEIDIVLPNIEISFNKEGFINEMNEWLNNEFHIIINLVDYIPREQNGKFKLVKRMS